MDNLEKITANFLNLTSSTNLHLKALKALSLHAFEACSKSNFDKLHLKQAIDEVLEKVKDKPINVNNSMELTSVTALMDICYVLCERGFHPVKPIREELTSYVKSVYDNGNILYAWMLGETTHSFGVDARLDNLKKSQDYYKNALSGLEYAYWLSHRFFLESKFLHKKSYSPSIIADLISLSDLIVEQEKIDLAAQFITCLNHVGKKDVKEYKKLLNIVTDNISGDGLVVDITLEKTEYNIAYTTSTAMLALASAN